MPDNTATTVTAITAVGSIAGAVLGAMFPQEKVLLLALQAVLREAPTLYVDFVRLLTKTEPTDADKAAFNAAAEALMNPESIYAESRKRLGQPV